MIKHWTIYKIINPYNRVYIGVTSNLAMRLRFYKNKYNDNQKLVMRSIRKYGFNNHSLEIVEQFDSTLSYAIDKEMFWIRTFMSNHSKFPHQNGMNLTDGGQGGIGKVTSEKTKKLLSISAKKYRHTDEAKKKIGAASKGNKYRLGHKMTTEQIEHRSSLLRGRKLSKELCEKRRNIFVEKYSKPIIQYSVNGEFIKEFKCCADAKKYYNNWAECSIPRVLNGKYFQTHGFIFKYKTL